MGWPAGRRRKACDARALVGALLEQYSARRLGRLAGVSDRTIRRWAAGEDWVDPDVLYRLIDRLFHRSKKLPSGVVELTAYDPERVHGTWLGVSEYSIRAARGR